MQSFHFFSPVFSLPCLTPSFPFFFFYSFFPSSSPMLLSFPFLHSFVSACPFLLSAIPLYSLFSFRPYFPFCSLYLKFPLFPSILFSYAFPFLYLSPLSQPVFFLSFSPCFLSYTFLLPLLAKPPMLTKWKRLVLHVPVTSMATVREELVMPCVPPSVSLFQWDEGRES